MPIIAPALAFLGTTAGATIATGAIAAGTALYSAGQQRDAAGRVLDANTTANNQSLAAQEAARNQITQLNQPFVNTGVAANAALANRLGLTGGAPTTPGISTPPATAGQVGTPASTAGQPDWQAYWDANPDLAASTWLAGINPGDLNHDGQVNNLDRAEMHYENYGKSEGRGLPTTAATPSPTPAPTPAPTSPQPAPTSPTGQPLDDHGMPVYTRPDTPPTPTFTAPTATRPDQPAFNDPGPAPDQSSYFKDFTTSPGYDFRLQQGQRNLNANFGAKGLLKSGSAIQGAIDYGQNTASTEYQNWFNQQNTKYNEATAQYNTGKQQDYNIFNTDRNNLNTNYENDRNVGLNQFNADRASGLNQFNADRANTNTNFTTDRSFGTDLAQANRTYDTNRYDTQTGNLFALNNSGITAAGATGSAASNFANNSTNIFGSQANAAADAANSRAAANSYGAGAIGGAIGNIFAAYGAQPTPLTAQTTQQPISAVPNFMLPDSSTLTRLPARVF